MDIVVPSKGNPDLKAGKPETEEEIKARVQEELKLKTQEGLIKKSVSEYLLAKDESEKEQVLAKLPEMKDAILAEVEKSLKSKTSQTDGIVESLRGRIEQLENEKKKEAEQKDINEARGFISTYVTSNNLNEAEFNTRYGKDINQIVEDKVSLGYSILDATELAISRIRPQSSSVVIDSSSNPIEPKTEIELTPKVKEFYKANGINI